MNSALLAKLAWMICSGERSICMDLLRAKYKVSNDWFRAEPPKIACLHGEKLSVPKNLLKKEHAINLVMAEQLVSGQIRGYHG